MTTQEKIKRLADLDGITVNTEINGCFNLNGRVIAALPNYPESFDAIIPLIQKQPATIKEQIANNPYWHVFNATPTQLCDELLAAISGKNKRYDRQ